MEFWGSAESDVRFLRRPGLPLAGPQRAGWIQRLPLVPKTSSNRHFEHFAAPNGAFENFAFPRVVKDPIVFPKGEELPRKRHSANGPHKS